MPLLVNPRICEFERNYFKFMVNGPQRTAIRAYFMKVIKREPIGGQLRKFSSSSVPDIGSAIIISLLFVLVKIYGENFDP